MHSLKINFQILLFICFSSNIIAQVPTPIAQKYKRVLILNGKAHIGTGKVIEKSVIGIVNRKIELVGNALTYKLNKTDWDTIIDVLGQEVYPGFIASNSTIGLTEIDAVRATNDFREVGTINPNVRALIAFNTDSKIIYTIRTNGVLVCQSVPRGGLISGTSSVFALDGWNWEDAVYKADDGIHINWPKKFHNSGWWAEPGIIKKNKNYQKTIDELQVFFNAAQVYLNEKNHDVIDLKMEALKGVFKGEKRVYIHADFGPEINDLIHFSRQFELEHPVLVGGYDAHYFVEILKENKFTVMLSNPHQLPKFEGELPSINYELASKLQKSGVLFCIQNAGDMEVMNARNLPFLGGTAMAYGLSEEEAIACLSLNAAKIMGIENRIGSIEVGKDATLFVSKGNALDMRTNNIVLALVKGNFIQLTNHQIELSNKYLKKYNLKP